MNFLFSAIEGIARKRYISFFSAIEGIVATKFELVDIVEILTNIKMHFVTILQKAQDQNQEEQL